MHARSVVVCAMSLFAAVEAAAVEGSSRSRSPHWVRWADAQQAMTDRGLTPDAIAAMAARAGRHGAEPLSRDPGPGVLGPTPWTGDGLPICNVVSHQVLPSAISDNSGGIIAAWTDFRDFTYDIYAGRLDGNGNPLWAPGGVALARNNGVLWQAVTMPDGANGAFVLFGQSTGSYFSDIFVQRVTSAGAISAGWPANGVSVAPGGATGFGAVPTDDGFLLMGWTDLGDQLRVVRRTGTGAVASGWTAAGLAIGRPPIDGNVRPAPDGAGGAFLCWAKADTVFLTRVTAGGAIPAGWSAAGTVVASFPAMPRRGLASALLTSGDVIVFWPDVRSGSDTDIYAKRFTAAGAAAAGWPAGGTRITSSVLVNDEEPFAVPDAAGGAVVLYAAGSDSLLAQRVTGSGTLAAGWTPSGVTLSRHSPYGASEPISDGASGALVAWSATKTTDDDLFAQRVTGAGARPAGWPDGGKAFCTATGVQNDQVIVTDGAAGLIAAWDDRRIAGQSRVFAARILTDGTVAALASLVSASAEPGIARLRWLCPDGARFEAGLERSASGGAFAEIARVHADGSGHVYYEDRDVTAGVTYRYRLAVAEAGATSYLGEVTLHVPSGSRLALAGFVPNPAVGAPRLAYALATAEPARIEVLDTAGRRVLERGVDSSPGEHVVSIEALGPGVYTLRLTQGSRSVTARAAIVR